MLAAELKGIHTGLLIAKELNLRRICIESDCAEALSLVKFGCPSFHPCFHVVKQVVDLLAEE